jgi:hypothetical protein
MIEKDHAASSSNSSNSGIKGNDLNKLT